MTRRRYDGFDDDRDFWRYEPSVPIEAKGGIKAASRQGRFAEKWWAQRWIQVLETLLHGGRLQRGRSYARKGQVLSIDIGKGRIDAQVQGSRPTPYKVAITVKPLDAAEWKRAADQLAKEAVFAAKLLGGEIPQDIERAFQAAGLSLFPARVRDIAGECSCPDWSNPCKHIAAVYYLVGEAFDGDPFLIFRLRGIEREQLMTQLLESAPEQAAEEPAPAPEPLDAERFWSAKPLPPDLLAGFEVPRATAALPRRLGSLPFWRAEVPFLDALKPTYESASRKAAALLAEDAPNDEADV